MKFQNFKQTEKYGCGLYALANCLGDARIVTDERLELSKGGNNIGQLNMWLLESGYNMFLDPLYFTCTDNRLPNEICEIRPSGENVISLPVLIDVQYSSSSLMHMVTGDITINGDLTVIDSLKDESEVTTLSKFNERYFRCFGLWHFRDIKSGSMLVRQYGISII